ncbi:carotenoid oxygenase family protein [Phenylobacterium sp.]|uniref:carotenoid oxygenase family protein n=1 Tax=Phenylobacterium sp. TaxID=1871053 RepID=UPI0025DFDD1E|nr:carotenoid oxygenase family protein [Phenylobacterium sp.]
MHRRHLLQTFAAATVVGGFAPEIAQAAAQLSRGAAAGLDWRLGFADLDADLAPAPMPRVQGRAPAGLAGSLYRNGPGKFHRPGGSVGHWFDGDGLMRAFRVSGGEAALAARFIDTAKRRTDIAAGAVVTPGFGTPARPGAQVGNNDDANAANISVMPAGGELWALWEAGSPIAVDPKDLSTKGVRTLRPDLAHMPFLAHPRPEPGGEVWNLGVSGAKAIVWRLAADGSVISADLTDLPMASYVHDFSATARSLIVILQPWVQDHMSMPYGDSFRWKPELGVKVLVLDKADLSRRRIYDLPPFFAFHYGAGWEEADGTIRFAGCLAPDASFATQNGRSLMQGVWTPEPSPGLALITLPPGGGGPARIERTGVTAEFPRSDARFAGVAQRYTVHATGGANDGPLFHGLAVHDWKTGRSDSFQFGPSHLVEEAVFTPRPGGAEELDGWLLAPASTWQPGPRSCTCSTPAMWPTARSAPGAPPAPCRSVCMGCSWPLKALSERPRLGVRRQARHGRCPRSRAEWNRALPPFLPMDVIPVSPQAKTGIHDRTRRHGDSEMPELEGGSRSLAAAKPG